MFVRLKFSKKGPIRFVGHLDMMRTFQKMFMRSDIPVAYSEGFSPHQIFSFATALAVGVSSEGEYMDLRLKEDMAIDELISIINKYAPRGIEMLEGVKLQDKEPKAMALLVAAKYIITLNTSTINQDMIDRLLEMDTIVVQKKTKKGKINDFDLKPGIFELTLKEDKLYMLLATGSSFNIKPEMILEKIADLNYFNYQRSDYNFHRIELYLEKDGFKSLIETKLD